jgi:hypothetical protein
MFCKRLFDQMLIVTALMINASAVFAYPGASIIYVKWDAAGGNNGASWTDAYTSLQVALQAATVDSEIWVAAGTYRPFMSLPANRVDTFQLKNGVALYGGFAGSETTREQRNWVTNVTILDGMQPASPDPTYAYHVVTGSGTEASAVLDGFTITGGRAEGPQSHEMGAGMYNDHGNPTVTNVIFYENYAFGFGGGMYNGHSSPTLTNVTFLENSVMHEGGGMYNSNSSPSMVSVVFDRNSATYGGGMFISSDSNPTLTDINFIGNSAVVSGGGMYNESNARLSNLIFIRNSAGYSGGGMQINHSNPIIDRVTFRGNIAASGGGVMINNQSYPTLTNVVFSGNYASDLGGGLNNDTWCSPTLTNVTMSGNEAGLAGGGIYNYDESNPTMVNSILWGNNAGVGEQIFNEYSNPTITYSDVQEGLTGTANINADPLFVRPPNPGGDGTWGTADDDYGDLRLQSTSPAINTGNNTAVPSGVFFDLDGMPRILDLTVDMGAYEFALKLYLPIAVR